METFPNKSLYLEHLDQWLIKTHILRSINKLASTSALMVMASQSTLNQSIRSNGSIPVCWNLESVFRILSGLWRCGCLAYVEGIETSWTCYVDQEHWLRHSSIAELITLTLHWSNLIGFGQPDDFKAIDWFVHWSVHANPKGMLLLIFFAQFHAIFLVKIVPIISVPNWIIITIKKRSIKNKVSSLLQNNFNWTSIQSISFESNFWII